MKIAIIGGGMAGLGTAYELAAQGKGHEVTIFEKSPFLGGLAGTLEISGVPIEQYYHHMFPTYHDFWEVSKKLGFYDAVYFKKARTATYFGGKLYPFTGALDLLRFAPLSFASRVRTGLFALYCKIKRNWRTLEKYTAEQWLCAHVGKESYDVIWRPLLHSKFGEFTDRISMVWLWGRIFERPSQFGYFEGGFFTFIDRVAAYLKKEGVTVRTSCPISGMIKNGETFTVTTADTGRETFDHVIVAAPPEAFSKIADALLPDDFKRSLTQFPYMGSICVLLALKRQLTPYYWINVSDELSPFVAIVEHTNFVPADTYGGLHPVYLSRYIATTDPLYRSSEPEILKQFLQHLKVVIPSFSEDIVAKHWVFRAPYTQPVVTLGYEARKPQYTTPVRGLWWVSMSHIYPWDRGTDHSFHEGRDLVRAILEKK